MTPILSVHEKEKQFGKRIACVAGVRRGGKGKRRAHEAREQTREDRAHFDFPHSLSTACHAGQ